MPLRPKRITSQADRYWAASVQDTAALAAIVSADRIDKQQRLVEDESKIYRYDEQAASGDIQPNDSDGTGVGNGNGWWILVESAAQDHQSLTNLQGGSAPERYHLTAAQHTIAIQAASASLAGYTTAIAQTFAGLKTYDDGIATDTIVEETATNGVSIDGVRNKDSFLEFTEISTPANPAADKGRFYAKDDGGITKPFFLDSSGTETNLLAGGVSRFDASVADSDADFTDIDTAYNAGNTRLLISGDLTQSTDVTIDTDSLYIYVPEDVTATFGSKRFIWGATLDLTIEGHGTIDADPSSKPLLDATGYTSSQLKLNGLKLIIGGAVNQGICKFGRQTFTNLEINLPNLQGAGLQAQGNGYFWDNIHFIGGGSSCYWVIKIAGGSSEGIVSNIFFSGTFKSADSSPVVLLREQTVANNFVFDTATNVWIDASGNMSNFRSTNGTISMEFNQGFTFLNNCYCKSGTLDITNEDDVYMTNVYAGLLTMTNSSASNNRFSNCDFNGNIVMAGDNNIFSNCETNLLTFNGGALDNQFTGCTTGNVVFSSGANDNMMTGCKTGTVNINSGSNNTRLTGCDTGTVTDDGTNSIIIDGIKRSGEMWQHDSSTELSIDTTLIDHAFRGFSAGILNNFTFQAGSTGSITVFASGTNTTVTSAGHGLSNGDIVTMHGTTDYNGTHIVSGVTTDTFEIPATFVGDDATGTWIQGDRLIAGSGTKGQYKIDWSISCHIASPNNVFHFHVYLNETDSDKSAAERQFASSDLGTLSGSSNFDMVPGDIIWMAVRNLTDSTNITLKHANLNLHQIK
ncbi:MAG: hypothetical protein V3U02_04540 [Calditrichia bacterium]